MSAFSVDEILGQLDSCAADYCFPMFDNGYVQLVETRLHAFADEARWAIVIECLGYNPREGVPLSNAVHVFGNCVGKPGLDGENRFLYPVESEVEDEDNPEQVSPEIDVVVVRGSELPLPERDEPGPIEALFRAIVPAHRDLFLATDDEIRALVPRDLPPLLRLDEWEHPDLAGGARPSDSETFRSLAEALVAHDAKRYRAQPPNTHWENWPDGGSL